MRALAPLFRLAPLTAQRLASRPVLRKIHGSAEHAAYAAKLAAALQDVGADTDGLLKGLCELPAHLHAERMLIRYGSERDLRRMQGDLEGLGIDAVHDAIKKGRGLILGCTHVGLFYHALFQAHRLKLGRAIVVVSGNQRPATQVIRRIEELSGQSIKVITAATSSTLSIARHLRNGGVLATMLDLHVDATLWMPAPFFGRPAATPAGIFQLSTSLGAPIVPLAVLGAAGDKRSVLLDSIIEPEGTAHELASFCNARIEQVIRAHPGLWSEWTSLHRRWDKASRPQTL